MQACFAQATQAKVEQRRGIRKIQIFYKLKYPSQVHTSIKRKEQGKGSRASQNRQSMPKHPSKQTFASRIGIIQSFQAHLPLNQNINLKTFIYETRNQELSKHQDPYPFREARKASDGEIEAKQNFFPLKIQERSQTQRQTLVKLLPFHAIQCVLP